MKVLLAQKLREFRKKQGLTQEQLAEAMGVTVGAVSKWESGASTPDVSLILELADFFETSVDVLLGYTQQSASLEGSVCRLRVSLVLCNCFLLSILQNSGGLSSLRRQNEKMVGKSKISC